jgi:peptidoglycan/LPS O-acetylase OafA/YrhL
LLQRMAVDGRSAADGDGAAPGPIAGAHAVRGSAGLMRLLTCVIATVAYIWQEQQEFAFPPLQLAVFVLGMGVLSLGLYLFWRGRSRVQPPAAIAGVLRLVGRHTLEIYTIQMAAFELVTKLMPDLAP